MTHVTHDYTQTYCGHRFYPRAPERLQVSILDIAHALSQIPRFGGHAPPSYTVARHSLLVADLVQKEYRAEALFHDAAEAYLGDVPTPIKVCLPDYRRMYTRLEEHIVESLRRIGIPLRYPWPFEVLLADREALAIDLPLLMGGGKAETWSFAYTRRKFLDAVLDLPRGPADPSPLAETGEITRRWRNVA